MLEQRPYIGNVVIRINALQDPSLEMPKFLSYLQVIVIFLHSVAQSTVNQSSFVFFKFYDLEELFRTGGQVPDTAYIFMVRSKTNEFTYKSYQFWINVYHWL